MTWSAKFTIFVRECKSKWKRGGRAKLPGPVAWGHRSVGPSLRKMIAFQHAISSQARTPDAPANFDSPWVHRAAICAKRRTLCRRGAHRRRATGRWRVGRRITGGDAGPGWSQILRAAQLGPLPARQTSRTCSLGPVVARAARTVFRRRRWLALRVCCGSWTPVRGRSQIARVGRAGIDRRPLPCDGCGGIVCAGGCCRIGAGC